MIDWHGGLGWRRDCHAIARNDKAGLVLGSDSNVIDKCHCKRLPSIGDEVAALAMT